MSVLKLLVIFAFCSMILSLHMKADHYQGFDDGDDNYTKIYAQDPNAKCLDGSTPAFYVHQGNQPNKILFYFLGGSTCASVNQTASLQQCYARSLTIFGSSLDSFWPQSYDAAGMGVLDPDPMKNAFAEWTKIFVLYCDGALMQGNNVNPVAYNTTTNLYFRGAVNTRSMFTWANNQVNFNNTAKKIVLMGSSSGGISVYLWIDYLRGLVTDTKKVYGVVDSGTFMDPITTVALGQEALSIGAFFFPAGTLPPSSSASSSLLLTPQSIDQFFAISNANERPPNTACLNSLRATNSSDWNCFFTPYASKYLATKLLWIMSQYDEYMIKSVMGFTCLVNGTSGSTIKDCNPPTWLIIDFYRSIASLQIFPALLAEGHGVWSIACSWHVSLIDGTIYDNEKQRAPFNGTRKTVAKAVQEYVFKNQQINLIDQYPWPSNRECAY